MSRTGLLLVLFLIGVALATSWLRSNIVSKPEQQHEKRYSADSFMENFQVMQYTDGGELIYVLKGTKLEHFTEGKTVIEQPEIDAQPDNPPDHWRLRANRATALSEKMDEITFSGDVVFNRLPADNVTATSLQSEHMLVNPKAERIIANGPVTIRSGESTTTGVKLEADLKQRLFTMQKVKSHYVQ